MIVYLGLVILSVFFTWLQQAGAFKYGLKLTFFLLFIFLALRYDYWNDYMGFFDGYLSLKSLQDEDFYFKGYEFGWLYLNYFFKYLFGDLGFHVMVAFMSAFSCIVLYLFTIKYIPIKYYTFGVALLLLEPNNILVLSSGMRQFIATGIFLLSFDYLLKRKYLHYVTGLFLASLFHSTVLIFILLILLNLVNWRIYLYHIILIFFGLFILLDKLGSSFELLNLFLESQESVYARYTINGYEQQKYGLGFALSIFLYMLVLIFNRKVANSEQNTIGKMSIVALLLLFLGLTLEMATRLAFYIFPLVVVGYVLMLSKLSELKFGASIVTAKLTAFIIVAFFAYQNYGFWQSKVYAPYFKEYKTIFQSPYLK
jgi:transmembrane protein EpsG